MARVGLRFTLNSSALRCLRSRLRADFISSLRHCAPQDSRRDSSLSRHELRRSAVRAGSYRGLGSLRVDCHGENIEREFAFCI